MVRDLKHKKTNYYMVLDVWDTLYIYIYIAILTFANISIYRKGLFLNLARGLIQP